MCTQAEAVQFVVVSLFITALAYKVTISQISMYVYVHTFMCACYVYVYELACILY